MPQTWVIQYRPDGIGPFNPNTGWYYGTADERRHLTSAAVGPFDTAQEACMDLTRAFITADALGPVEDRDEPEDPDREDGDQT